MNFLYSIHATETTHLILSITFLVMVFYVRHPERVARNRADAG